jgi:hypothetical protein
MNLRDAKRTLKGLTPMQLRKFDGWLHALIERADHDERERLANERNVPKEKRAGQMTYRLQSVRCGSKRCRCAAGEPRGPYWYAYWSEGGRTKSQYVGKKPLTNKGR